MRRFGKIWAVSLLSFAAAQLAAERLVPSAAVSRLEPVAWGALIPLLQAILLSVVRRDPGGAGRTGLEADEVAGATEATAVSRSLAVWGLLAVAFATGRHAASFLLFRHLDVTFEAFAQILLVPAAQAGAFAFLAPRRDRPGLPSPAREPWAAGLLVADLLLVGASFVWPRLEALSARPLGELPVSLLSLAVAVKSVAAIAWLARDMGRRRARDGEERPKRPFLERAGSLLLAAGCAGYGLDAATGWILKAPARLFPQLLAPVQWLVTIPALFAVSMTLLLRLAATGRAARTGARAPLGWAAGLGIASATVVVLSLYQRPFLVAPWAQLVHGASYLAFSSLFLAVRAWSRPARPGVSPVPEGEA